MGKILYEPPKLIAIGGPPAVGKSHLAQCLAERIACAYFRRGYTILDVLDKFEAPVQRNAASNPEYRRRADEAFEIFYRFAEENLGLGNTALLDTPFNNIRWGQRDERLDGIIRRYVANPVIDFRLFVCTAPDDVIRERMATRDGGKPKPEDVSKLDNWKEYSARMHRTGDITYPYVSIDTTKPAEENVETMLRDMASSSTLK